MVKKENAMEEEEGWRGEKCERDAPDLGPHSFFQPSGLGTAERDRCSSAELGKSRTGGTEK